MEHHHIHYAEYAPATARVLDGLLNELGYSLRFELGVRTEREGACNQTERERDRERQGKEIERKKDSKVSYCSIVYGSLRLTLILLDAHVPYTVVQLEAQREDVMIVRAVAHYERTIWLIGEHLLGRLTGQWTPVPAILQRENIL